MRTYTGSLQRRGRRYYLVIHHGGRQRWLALKTDKLPLARQRASQLAPRDPDDEVQWLEQLIREGERARVRLARRHAMTSLSWNDLAKLSVSVVDVGSTAVSVECHQRWMEILHATALLEDPDCRPGSLTADCAAKVTDRLRSLYISAPRMMSYYRKVWKAAGMDCEIWSKPSTKMACTKFKEHYRRLSRDEIRKVYELASGRSSSLADMIAIGYATGLRLSDVAELELSEIEFPFLRVCPNKTRRHKPLPLKIPLIASVRLVIARLQAAAEKSGCKFLFSTYDRHRPSRRIAKAFRAAGVLKDGAGRASFHSLRATFISMMDDAGVSPYVTDSITGHGGGNMHARYTQPSDEALLTAVARAIPDILCPLERKV